MEEPQSIPPSGGDQSAKTGESLRALRNQADQALESHRQRVGDIEAEINRCVEQVAAELARDRAAGEIEADASAQQLAELKRLRDVFAEKQSEIDQLRILLTSQSSEYESQLAQREHEIEDFRDHVEHDHAQLQNQLDERQSELAQLHDEHELLRQANEAERAEGDELLDRQRAEWQQQLDELKGQLDQRDHDNSQLTQQLDETRNELEALLNRECDDCATTSAELAHALQKLQEVEQQFDDAEAKNASAAELLQEAEQRIIELNRCAGYEEQLQQTERKFELALADVHKLKKENTELHEELVRRPETDDKESPELVSLRAERDALATRMAELESDADQPVDADTEQQMADLRRRFEMAVDDVRELKQQNAALQTRLETTSESAGDTLADTGLDWQSQKARMLAALDAEEGDDNTPEHTEERATIEGTISITDRVVSEKDAELAEKDSEIAKLRAQIGTESGEQDLDDVRQSIEAEVLGNDELVQAERKRLKQLQQEMHEKLREAELEISVQRATLARGQADLEEQLAKFQTADSESPTPDEGKPRRRWLSALGIKDDEDE